MKLPMNVLAVGLMVTIGAVRGAAADALTPPGGATGVTFLEPKPLQKGATVVTLWPAGSPALRPLEGYDQEENFQRWRGPDGDVGAVTNVHNPSIELHLAPADKANGMAIILAPGGGNKTLVVGPEGLEVAAWLNSLGVSAFVERYRLKPYGSGTDALADTQRAFRLVRAHAKEWNVDPKRVGIMGFSAGGEQAARIAMNFDGGNPDAADLIERQSDRPDFVVLVYAGWQPGLDLSKVPKNAPPAFCACAGVDDYFHASETMDFSNAWLNANIPVELHIYAHGGHGGSINPRKGIPFGTWHNRFIEWVTDMGMMKAVK
jgi:hypothetical protein